MLQRLTALNDRIPLHNSTLTRFHSRGAPQISLVDYLQRIVRYAALEPICLLVLLIYIDRICNRSRTFIVSSLTVHRLVITAFCCASKALCDSYLTNATYAKIGGVSTHELNILELDFLSLIDWDVCCNADLLQIYYVNLVKQHPAYTRKPPPPLRSPTRWAGQHHPP
ncbi:hypothetical protein HDU87_007702 [Geranomyces variabilis]|uniref:Cyclin n=1 Tax=Geranomyces variabilis TaxID=109894 RepID=A0AAD5XK90_9FUNG|nr:hypothetical protein HDU87_007702 [Geranomyces variabilis]